jgi:hypothetical protein
MQSTSTAGELYRYVASRLNRNSFQSADLSMASSVKQAFREFISNKVNLNSQVSDNARSSRDWLLDQIHSLPSDGSNFPRLYDSKDVYYGSFARKTKVRELDDIDLILGVSAQGATYVHQQGKVVLSVPDGIVLRGLCYDGINLLNSRKVVNIFVKHLSQIPQYEKAEIGRNGSAAVLNLSSYTWSFDIVPGFFTMPEADGRTYYLIPDGYGHWMKTDPRIDQDRVSSINQHHDGNVLNVIRALKYWNERATAPAMGSYLLECIILDHYDSKIDTASNHVCDELQSVLNHVSQSVMSSVRDPKGIQGNINNGSWENRRKIASRASSDATIAAKAYRKESRDDHEAAIRLWGDIFGPDFPNYG